MAVAYWHKPILTNQPHDLVCEYALTSPSLTHVIWNLSENCGPISGSSVPRQTWVGDNNPGLREADLSPVIRTYSGFATTAAQFKDPRDYHLCPGSTFTFTKSHILRRRMIDATLPPIDPTIYIPLPTKHEPTPNTVPIPPEDIE